MNKNDVNCQVCGKVIVEDYYGEYNGNYTYTPDEAAQSVWCIQQTAGEVGEEKPINQYFHVCWRCQELIAVHRDKVHQKNPKLIYR
jgi:formylmethanofuran dehydrogenase subunit E